MPYTFYHWASVGRQADGFGCYAVAPVFDSYACPALGIANMSIYGLDRKMRSNGILDPKTPKRAGRGKR